MSSELYLTLMLGTITILVLIFIPALLWRRCDSCGTRNGLDATECKQCKKAFPES